MFWVPYLRLSFDGINNGNFIDDKGQKSKIYQNIALCSSPQVSFHNVISSQGQAITFSRTLSRVNKHEWEELLNIIRTFTAETDLDVLNWRWTSSGKFTVKSLYSFLNFSGIQDIQLMKWWTVKLPPKIKIFM